MNFSVILSFINMKLYIPFGVIGVFMLLVLVMSLYYAVVISLTNLISKGRLFFSDIWSEILYTNQLFGIGRAQSSFTKGILIQMFHCPKNVLFVNHWYTVDTPWHSKVKGILTTPVVLKQAIKQSVFLSISQI